VHVKHAAELDVEAEHASSAQLARLISRLLPQDGAQELAPGLFAGRSSSRAGPFYAVLEPSLCIVAQGRKEMTLGEESYRYDPATYLLVATKLPLVGRVIDASPDRPYLSIRIALDPKTVASVLLEADGGTPPPRDTVRGIAVSRLDSALLDVAERLLRLVESPNDYRVLAPLAVRELAYRLSLGDQGHLLRQIAVVGSHGHQIAQAIEQIRANSHLPLSVSDLARQVAMSVSAFHSHFKAITGTTPLQFQKQLRLYEARQLLLPGDVDAATVGYRVGYEDPSHFSRDYKRQFGEPPARHVERIRSAAVGA
jgi:AraC-like DNA-binding protein